MAKRRVGAVLVIDGDALIGIMTERDVLRAVGSGKIDGTVGDWMTRDPITVGPDATHGEAAMMMIHGGFRHVPIIEAGKLIGIVSIRDLLLPAQRDARPGLSRSFECRQTWRGAPRLLPAGLGDR